MIFELAQAQGLLPLVFLLVCRFILERRGRGEELPEAWWWVVSGLTVSWVADSAMHFAGGPWTTWYLFAPFQVWLVLCAFVTSPMHRGLSFIFFMFLARASWNLSAPGPDLLVGLLGSIAILVVATGRMRWPLYIYFGAGTMARLIMVDLAGKGIDFMPAWKAYQGCRLAAIVAIIGIISPQVIHYGRIYQWLKDIFLRLYRRSVSWPPFVRGGR